MSNSRIERQANFTRLTQELVTHAQQLGRPFEPSPFATKLSEGLFLAHSTTRSNFTKVCAAQRILSQAKLATERGVPLKNCAEIKLGTSNDVFFYAATFRYPTTACGLLFASSLEVENKEIGAATPFDSGGLFGHITRPNTIESEKTFLDKNEMPIPEHRQYLSQAMMALFNDPKEYVEGVPPCHNSPLGLIGKDQHGRHWTHEVRIPENVPVQGSPHLQAVFAPRALAARNPSVRALFRHCKSEGVDTIPIDTPRGDDFEELQQACLAYIRRKLY